MSLFSSFCFVWQFHHHFSSSPRHQINLDDEVQTKKTFKSLGPFLKRNFIVPELCANLLAECSAEDLRATTMYKDSAFIYAANSGMVSLLEVFVQKGQDINVTDDEGSTALHSAVVNNQPDSVRELLRLGIDTTIKTNLPADPEDEPAMTALELAEGGGFEGSEEMVAILKAGCNN